MKGEFNGRWMRLEKSAQKALSLLLLFFVYIHINFHLSRLTIVSFLPVVAATWILDNLLFVIIVIHNREKEPMPSFWLPDMHECGKHKTQLCLSKVMFLGFFKGMKKYSHRCNSLPSAFHYIACKLFVNETVSLLWNSCHQEGLQSSNCSIASVSAHCKLR